MSRLIRCQVLEIPAADHLEFGSLPGAERDMLPWADPYIAALLTKLDREEPADADDGYDAPHHEFADREFPRSEFHDLDLGDDGELDAALVDEAAAIYERFFPDCSDSRTARGENSKVYGGWPLLDDASGR